MHKKVFAYLILIILLLSIFSLSVFAAWTDQDKITPSDGVTGDWFGRKVDIDGDYAVVGAIYHNSSQGAAYVYKRSGSNWSQVAKLTASDAADNDQFGYSVSISGNFILVGAVQDDDDGAESGSAYFFKKPGGGWFNMTETDKVSAGTDGDGGDYFGWSVAVDGNYAVITAAYDDAYFGLGGSAYIFKTADGGSNWSKVKKFASSDIAGSDRFGYYCDLDGDYAVIGAPYGDAAYVFNKDQGGGDNWGEQAILTQSDSSGDRFGWTVGISGDYVVSGAYLDDDNAYNAGAAYIYEKPGGGWSNMTETQKIIASEGDDGDYFGIGVGISGNYVAVGADSDEENGGNAAGAVYIFERGASTWSQTNKILATEGSAGDHFGHDVAVSGYYIIGGSYLDGPGSANILYETYGDVPEFRDYVYILALIVSLGIMFVVVRRFSFSKIRK